MKRVNNKLAGVICMAMAIFSMTTGSVEASAAGYYKPAPRAQEQTSTTQKQSGTTRQDRGTSSDSSSVSGKADTTSSSNAYLTKQQQSILDQLGTDYSKVNWGVEYSPKGMDGIIISVADYMDGRYPYLVVAVTNIYDRDVTFSASGSALGTRGQEVADLSFYEDAIRPGSTVAKVVYCDNTPTGEIYWDELDLPKGYYESASWEGDWHFTTDTDGYFKVNYNVDSDDYMSPGTVTALLLNRNGDIIDAAYDYSADKGYYVSGTIEFFEKDYDEKVVDVAMFTNPTKSK